MKVGENEEGRGKRDIYGCCWFVSSVHGRSAALSLKSTHGGAQLCLGLKQKFGGCHSCFKGVWDLIENHKRTLKLVESRRAMKENMEESSSSPSSFARTMWRKRKVRWKCETTYILVIFFVTVLVRQSDCLPPSAFFDLTKCKYASRTHIVVNCNFLKVRWFNGSYPAPSLPKRVS